MTTCTFVGNSADHDGGGLIGDYSVRLTVTNCDIRENTTNDDGGGLYLGSMIVDPTVTGCTFENNTAFDRGGGMYNSASNTVVLADSGFSGNSAGIGTGIYNKSRRRIHASGELFGDDEFVNLGVLSPGRTASRTSIGALTISMPFTQSSPGESAGALVIDLAGAKPGKGHDQVTLTRSTSLNRASPSSASCRR